MSGMKVGGECSFKRDMVLKLLRPFLENINRGSKMLIALFNDPLRESLNFECNPVNWFYYQLVISFRLY